MAKKKTEKTVTSHIKSQLYNIEIMKDQRLQGAIEAVENQNKSRFDLAMDQVDDLNRIATEYNDMLDYLFESQTGEDE